RAENAANFFRSSARARTQGELGNAVARCYRVFSAATNTLLARALVLVHLRQQLAASPDGLVVIIIVMSLSALCIGWQNASVSHWAPDSRLVEEPIGIPIDAVVNRIIGVESDEGSRMREANGPAPRGLDNFSTRTCVRQSLRDIAVRGPK